MSARSKPLEPEVLDAEFTNNKTSGPYTSGAERVVYKTPPAQPFSGLGGGLGAVLLGAVVGVVLDRIDVLPLDDDDDDAADEVPVITKPSERRRERLRQRKR